MATIDGKTNIPLFAVIAAVPVIVTAILYVASARADSHEALTKVNAEEKRIEKIQMSLLRIELKLGTYPKNKSFEENFDE